jgi:hypothetical protein
VDAAIRLKEKRIATEVVVVSIGVKPAQEALRNALAMGADRAKMTYAKGVLAEGVRQDGILTAPPEGAPKAPAAGEAPAEGGRAVGGIPGPSRRLARPDATGPMRTVDLDRFCALASPEADVRPLLRQSLGHDDTDCRPKLPFAHSASDRHQHQS